MEAAPARTLGACNHGLVLEGWPPDALAVVAAAGITVLATVCTAISFTWALEQALSGDPSQVRVGAAVLRSAAMSEWATDRDIALILDVVRTIERQNPGGDVRGRQV